MAEQLIGVGFWRNLRQPSLPDPAWFVDQQWSPMEQQKVLAYLAQGRYLHYWMGLSWCRFRCGENNMGACDLTDGTYCWPEGLAHYIIKHHVRLPKEVVQHILSQSEFPFAKAAQALQGLYDTSWWQQQRGWHSADSSFVSGDDGEERNYLRRFDRNQIEFNETTDVTAEAVAARERLVQSLREKYSTGQSSQPRPRPPRLTGSTPSPLR
ncbi:hypothetical protein MUN81_17465 [Hymenobacter sp. 5317J-9]|uniref:hypothetical protein n=1 Tax=Hymenobacter sp. 5317J-9 TaxID=2932250 RepID=UPI001FD6741F|nr:hypothetical protein [Hymenobacter sp. 5317J-9]UOQ97016.1 hypothetical protein MUN81_17465 [Hymenobacter sp. 5317J-9]